MKKEILEENGVKILYMESCEVVISSGQSALDLMADSMYHDDCARLALNKNAVTEDFFDLKTGVAGEVLQKFVNYGGKLAIVGDFSQYGSKALTDFIYECNNGSTIFFVGTKGEAIDRLSRAK